MKNMSIIFLSCEIDHSLCLRADGTVEIRGIDQISNPSNLIQHKDLHKIPITDVVQILALNRHDLFLKADGTVWGYGQNSTYQLSNMKNNNINIADIPIQIPGLSNIIQMAAGYKPHIFLQSDGIVLGYGLYIAQLGAADQPRVIPGLPPIKQIASGDKYSLFLSHEGNVYFLESTSINKVDVSVPIIAIYAGYDRYFLVAEDNILMYEGMKQQPQFLNMKNIIQIAIGMYHSLFLSSSGDVYILGFVPYTTQESIFSSSRLTVPTKLPMSNIIQVAAGGDSSLILSKTGSVYALGDNKLYQISSQDSRTLYTPTQVI